MLQDSDRVDVERVLAGDVNAFAGIVERWQGPLVSLAFRFCRDRDRAEDMAQDAFVRAFRFLHRWRRDAAFSTWLFAIALNVFRTALRRDRRPPLAADPEAVARIRGAGSAQRTRGMASSPPDGSEDAMADALRRTVARLPRRYREAVILYYFLEQNVTEAAAVLGVPEGTVKARLHRGRAILKERMAGLLQAQPGARR
jgi:RNA polymerase sigma-70 factor (ECF subfamily)